MRILRLYNRQKSLNQISLRSDGQWPQYICTQLYILEIIVSIGRYNERTKRNENNEHSKVGHFDTEK